MTHEHLAIYVAIHCAILAEYSTHDYQPINNYLHFPYNEVIALFHKYHKNSQPGVACKTDKVLARPTVSYTLTTQIAAPILDVRSITPSTSEYSCDKHHEVSVVQVQVIKTPEAEVPNTDEKYHPKLRLVCLLRTFKISLLH